MATQAKKVWCPQCHKRHQLPPDVGEMTLRCRKCRFAFDLSDGLTSDPTIERSAATSSKSGSAKDSSFDVVDGDYDDIMDVLSSPDDELAPARAHVKSTAIDREAENEKPEPEPAKPEAQPVTRQRLRAQKNTRRIMMLVSFLLACVLCVVSWFIGRDLADQQLSDWERRMLYAMGAPARLLPPQPINEEILLPVNHVKLRGDFIELADRSDSYRDDFPRPENELALAAIATKPATKPAKPKTNPSRKPAKPNVVEPRNTPPRTSPPTPKRSEKKVAGSNSSKKPTAKPKRQGLLIPNEVAVDSDDFNLHEVARSPRFSASIESLISLPENRIAFFVKDKDYQAFGFAERNEADWSIKPIELGTKLTVKDFDITDDGKRIAIWSRDLIQFWEINEPGKAKLIAETTAHSAEISQLELTNDGKKAISGDRSGKLFVSVFETGQRIESIAGFRTPIKCIVAKGASGFVAMDQRGITRGVRAPVAPFPTSVSQACALSVNGTKLAYVRSSKEITVADIGSRKGLNKFPVETGCSWLAFAGDIKHLVTQNRSDLAVWNWRRGERLRVFRFARPKNGKPVAVAISDDSQTVAVATGEDRNQISIYEMPGAEKE